ncbi:Uma2 family endonuclease [Chroococcidiopsis sp. CCMEE 29]|uniref:Uma2 family endonuclease n=1 Tax=Chroococcidiopsis sp. CCMEE 29 TaxID=155894 RepID=UPI00202206D7|nr:Uma2 family endonuclease [Chroococcidiopsis sp. CCMEE 29]
MTIITAKRFTLEEYHRLADLGFFSEDDRVELIRGEIIQMAAKGTAHTNCCRNLLRELAALIAGQAELQCQDPITLPSNSEPEPDFVILRQRDDNYRYALPNPSDVLLIIEIANSTLKYDQEVKLPLYAEAGISDYWLFNLVENHLEAYSEPYQELQGTFGYRVKRIFLLNEVVTFICFPDLSLDLSRVFPKFKE